MKTIIIKLFKDLLLDRYLLVLLSTMVILALWFAVSIGLSIHPSESQLVSHYSAFGSTFFYSDHWLYLALFVLFEVIVVCLHIVITVKILEVKGHSLAIMYAWISLAVIVLGWATADKLMLLRAIL